MRRPLFRRWRPFRREIGTLLGLAGPIVVSQLGQVGMNTTDTIMVGPLGATPLAAVGLASALHAFVLMVATGVVLGSGPLVSQAFGAGRRGECREVLVQAGWVALAASLPLVAFQLAGRPLALLLGQPSEVAALAGGYMAALAPGVPAILLFFAFRQFLEGMGRTLPAMVITFLGLAVNVAANRALIYGVPGWVPALGAVGSGWATSLVRLVMLGAMVLYLALHPRFHPFRGVRFRPRAELLARIARIGGPISAQLGLEMGLFSFAAVMMGWFGPVELAAHQVTINIAATTFMVALGVSLAGSIRVGQHLGASARPAARRAAIATYALSLGFMGTCALVFLLVPRVLIGLYTRDPRILALASSLLVIAALFQLFDGAQVAGLNALRGAADTTVPMWICAVGYWGVGLPVALGLGFRTPLGPYGVWAGLSAGLAAVALLLAWRVRRVLWTPAARGTWGAR